MDISSDLAAVQQRIATILGTQTSPGPIADAAPAPVEAPSFGSLLNHLAQEAAVARQSSPMLMPVTGDITSPFGERQNPLGAGTEFHPGVDIAADEGTPIRAAMGGRVVGVGRDGGYGNLVTIDDGNGLTTRYAHCSQVFARIGQNVAPGDVIAAVGSTGRATGPHLHFEVRENDRPVDPLPFLPK